MKVIIQDIAAKEFLGEDGQWVADKSEARDFFTLLRAYHFAQANTSVRFRVLLHCPDDDYSANIIEGVGTASEEIAAFRVPVTQAKMQEVKPHFSRTLILSENFDLARIYWN